MCTVASVRPRVKSAVAAPHTVRGLLPCRCWRAHGELYVDSTTMGMLTSVLVCLSDNYYDKGDADAASRQRGRGWDIRRESGLTGPDSGSPG